MNCNCREEMEAKLEEKVKALLPEGFENYDAKLTCYGFGMIGNRLISIITLPYEGHAMVPKKNGGMKKQQIAYPIRPSYCPFCGEKVEQEAE